MCGAAAFTVRTSLSSLDPGAAEAWIHRRVSSDAVSEAITAFDTRFGAFCNALNVELAGAKSPADLRLICCKGMRGLARYTTRPRAPKEEAFVQVCMVALLTTIFRLLGLPYKVRVRQCVSGGRYGWCPCSL